ncbi:DUF1273 domain-containing protein [Limosilactobacillus oris]|uniref:DUF1273 domain-containing protein n=1 Tax=Limosilactobacillus oris TaxID=1632 RepID=UPI00242A8B6A|nr:DUF1273 domain-containing protein [Limosilactobacillus oris]
MRRLWLTGYRSYELNAFQDDDPKAAVVKRVLTQRLTSLLEEDDDEFWVITGPQLGVEQWGAAVALELKKNFRQLKVAMMLPFADFGQQWNATNRDRLLNLRDRVDFAREVTTKPYESPEQLRLYQRFMLDHTDSMLMVYDPDHPGKPKYDYELAQKYGDQQDYPVDLVDLDELQEAAIEWGEEQRERKLAEQDY